VPASIPLTVWWARSPHFPKLNVTVWFDDSDEVGLEDCGFRPQR